MALTSVMGPQRRQDARISMAGAGGTAVTDSPLDVHRSHIARENHRENAVPKEVNTFVPQKEPGEPRGQEHSGALPSHRCG